MKKTIMTMMTLAFATIGLVGISQAGDEKEIERTVRGFLGAADRQDVRAVDGYLHSEFRVVYNVRGKLGTTVLNSATYKKLLQDKKIGGMARAVKILDVSRQESMAVVRSSSEHAAARFDSTTTLVVDGGRWKLISEAVVMTIK